MQKEGEVKILRDNLKKKDQEIQRVRNEKIEMIRKLQQQQIDAQKNLDKQMELKDLDKEFKKQELTDLKMKLKQYEAKMKKISANSGASSQANFSMVKNEPPQYGQQMNTSNIFDEEFSRKKGNVQQPPPLNPSVTIVNNKSKIKYNLFKEFYN